MGALRIRSLSRVVRLPDGRELPIVKDLSLLLMPGEGIGVTGPADAGGRALLRLVAELDPRSDGDVEFLRRPDEPDPGYGDRRIRRRSAVLASALAPLLASGVERALAEPASFAAARRAGGPSATAEEVRAFARVDERRSTPLDRGETLRLCLALARTLRPSHLLVDAPRPLLTTAERRPLVDVLRRLKAEGLGVLLATQDEPLIAAICDRVLLIFDGVVTAEGTPADVMPAAVAAWRAEERGA